MRNFIHQKLLPKSVGFGLNLLSYFNFNLSGKYAFNLFCAPRKGRLLPEDITFLQTNDCADFLTTQYGKIKSYLWNEHGKKTLLLLHGWESNAARWKFLIPILKKNDYRIVAIDAPAHGGSEGKSFYITEYASAIEAAVLRYQPDSIIAHSLGGATLSYYLQHFSVTNIQKVVFLAAPTELKKMIGLYKNLLGLSSRVENAIESFFKNQFKKSVSYFSSLQYEVRTNIQTLLIHDEHDDIVPFNDSIAHHQKIPHSKIVVTKGLGHKLQGTKVFEEILSFLLTKKDAPNFH